MWLCPSNIFTAGNLAQNSTVRDPKKISKDTTDILRAKATNLSNKFVF